MASELLKLKWNGHLSSFQEIFQSLRAKSRYTDVTLACEGQLFAVHRLVLASCSQFFDHIFEQTPAENTVIILNEAKAHDIEALLDYMYCGQVDVRQSHLNSFIKTARCLQIKGLATDSSDDCDKEGKRYCTFEVDSSSKRKRNDTLPALQPTVLSPVSKSSVNRTPPESPPKTSSPSTFPAPHNRWVFHRSDLPNTTWSSSHCQEENEGRENEAFRANISYGSEVWSSSAEDPSSNSPNINLERKRAQSARNENDNNGALHLTANQYYKESHDIKEEKLEIVPKVKEEEENERESEENEQFLNAEYSHNYSFNASYEREDSSECFSNSISSRRHVFESQPMISHELYNQNKFSVPSSVSKDIPATTSHATVSSKLMPYAKCSNCLTNNTKLWRRSMKGEIVCNACGLYYKLHGVNRPSHLFRNAPMTRRRNPRKKKNLYEEMGESRDHSSTEDRNESLYNESGFDENDTQDGLAVLNAALTLNSLFAKAKAQEAAAAAAAAAANCRSDIGASQPIVMHSNSEVDGSKDEVGIDVQTSLETRPPPPLLKLPTARSISPSLRLPVYSSSSCPSSTSSSYSSLSGNQQKETMAQPLGNMEQSDFSNT